MLRSVVTYIISTILAQSIEEKEDELKTILIDSFVPESLC